MRAGLEEPDSAPEAPSRLHGTVAKTRALELHRITNKLVRSFGTIGIEDLNVAGMGSRKGRLGRSVADAALSEPAASSPTRRPIEAPSSW